MTALYRFFALIYYPGEFSSPKQGTFYHYNDFWRLDTSNKEWTRLESKGKGPPARSGHRMTYYKVSYCMPRYDTRYSNVSTRIT